jgi:hypothetical protein
MSSAPAREGITADEALSDALLTVDVTDLEQVASVARPEPPPFAANLTVEARHEQGLVARLAVQLNAFEVTAFSYRVDQGGRARLDLMVQGGDAKLVRAAARLRRIVGVETVCTR